MKRTNFLSILGLLLLFSVGYAIGRSGWWLNSWYDRLITASAHWITENVQSILTDDQASHLSGHDSLEPHAESKFKIIPPRSWFADIEDFNLDLIETEIFRLTNQSRQAEGLEPLSPDSVLTEAAKIRAKESAILFSHDRPDGRDAFTVFDPNHRLSYPYQIVGENLGKGTLHGNEENMAEFIYQGWVESHGHYENIIRPEFQEMGVGIYYEDHYLYITQLFGTKR